MAKNKIISILAQFLGQGNTLTNSVILIDVCGGSHTASLMLSQLFYWHGRTKIPGGWIAKSDKEWHEELRLSPKQARWCRAKLIEYGFIETKTKRFNNKPTVHYRINENRVLEEIDALCPGGQNVSPWRAKQKCPGGQNRNALEGKTLTEPTTEPTTEPIAEVEKKSHRQIEEAKISAIKGAVMKNPDSVFIEQAKAELKRKGLNFDRELNSYAIHLIASEEFPLKKPEEFPRRFLSACRHSARNAPQNPSYKSQSNSIDKLFD